MKVLATLVLLFTLAAADTCPQKVLEFTTKSISNYFKGYYKKVGNIDVSCSYEHDNNIFNLEHKIKAQATFNKRKLNFEAKTHSTMFNLENFTDFDGMICHSKIDGAKERKDVDLIKRVFLKKFAGNIKDDNIRKTEKNGQVCYKAKVAKKARVLKQLKKSRKHTKTLI